MTPSPDHSVRQAASKMSLAEILRKNMAIVVTLFLFAMGSYALYRLLAPLNMVEVLASLRATPWQVYLPAILATIGAYIALIGYDWSALRYIGKPLPLPFVALGGFLGYAFGNTIGLSAVSGGAARYRIYAALGLDGYDVAAISSFVSLAYGIGATLIGLGALALYPAALHGIWNIDPVALRFWAIFALSATTALMLGLAWHGGTLRLGRFALRAPNIGDLSRQLMFTAADISMATLVLYVLLPPGSMPYPYLLAVYAIATMVGIASHVPGGVGVFESVVIAALPTALPLGDAVTALLLFRLVYFLLPFLVALALLSAIEVWTATGRSNTLTRLMPVFSAGRSVIPMAVGFLVLSAGLFMMFAGLLPNPRLTLEDLQAILPLAMIEGGAMVSSVVGSLLVVLALALFRRSWAAYWLVMAALSGGIVLALIRLQDPQRVVLLVVFAVILVPCRREFYRAARIAQGLWSAQWVAFILAIGGVIWLTFFAVHESAPFATLTWWQFALDADAAQAQRAMLAAGVVLSAALLYSALRAKRFEVRSPDGPSVERVRRIVDAAGQARDMLALSGDKLLMFSPRGDAVLSYGVQGASWIALGAPVGTLSGCGELAWEFHDAARAAGARPVFLATPGEFTEQAIEMGLALHRMGEEAVVDLHTNAPEVQAYLSAARARAEAAGLSFTLQQPPHAPALLTELAGLASAKGGGATQFLTGPVEPEYLQQFPLALVRHAGRVVAFANVLQTRHHDSAAVDLRHTAPDAPAHAAQFLLSALVEALAALGYEELSLGLVAGAPSQGASARGGDLWARFWALAGSGDAPDAERTIWAPFAPDWRPRYFCCRSVLPPRAPLADAARLIAGSAKGLEEAAIAPT